MEPQRVVVGQAETKDKPVEGIVASVISVALFIVMLIQIFGRTPILEEPVWTREAARGLWVWMAFLGIAAVEDIVARSAKAVAALAADLRAPLGITRIVLGGSIGLAPGNLEGVYRHLVTVHDDGLSLSSATTLHDGVSDAPAIDHLMRAAAMF